MPLPAIIIWHVATDSADWRRLAEQVLKRRTQLRLSQLDIQTRGGPSTATMRLIEGALQDNYRPVVLSRLEIALGWEPGSVRKILGGGEPTLHVPERNGTVTVSEGRPPALDELLRTQLDILSSNMPEETKLRLIEELVRRQLRSDRAAELDVG